MRVLPTEVSAGELANVYDPSIGGSSAWYINDHTFIRADDGTWHIFGITHEEAAAPTEEVNFAHATAPGLKGPWTKQAYALSVDANYEETHLWAAHVIKANDTYYMFYCGGAPDLNAYEINLASSIDLFNWTCRPDGPLFRDGYEARDPYVTRIGDQWVMYYEGTSDPTGGNYVVMYRTSTDLMTWSDRQIAYTDPTSGTGGRVTESPFVYPHSGHYYLFIGPRPSQPTYVGTDIFKSDDVIYFDIANQVGHIASHALEVVVDDSAEYVSSAGWGQGGVSLAPLHWTS